MPPLLEAVAETVAGSAIIGGLGLAVTWGMVRQMVKDDRERLTRAEEKIEALQGAMGQTPMLAQSIEHMGEKFATAIQHLAERFGEQNKHVQDQLAGIKTEQHELRRQLGVRRPRGAKTAG